MTKYPFFIFLCFFFYQCDNSNTNSYPEYIEDPVEYIDLSPYDIEKQQVDSVPSLDFKNAIIDSDLHFVPNKETDESFYKSDYHGDVKQITTYMKGPNDAYPEFFHMDKFNRNGDKIESEYPYAGTLKYFYDSKYNLIQEIKIKYGDTIHVKDISYNNENKIVSIKEINFQESEDYEFNTDVFIEYDTKDRPAKIISNNVNNKYIKNIKYAENKVTIIRIEDSVEVRKEIYIYSETYKLLKEKINNNAYFMTYDENDRIASNMTYWDNDYCCTNFYEYNEKGVVTKSIFTNHVKDHQEINSYERRLDSLDNVIYSLSLNNVLNDEYETHYEIEYFED